MRMKVAPQVSTRILMRLMTALEDGGRGFACVSSPLLSCELPRLVPAPICNEDSQQSRIEAGVASSSNIEHARS